jgi:predicted AAA+ superfamily ATPase
MSDVLTATFHRLISATTLDSHRALYHEFNLKNRLTGIVGARGVGKTTLMLQYLKAHLYDSGKAFYFSADHLFFNTQPLYTFLEALHQQQGIEIIFIDEIHKYPNWSQELKNIYDAFPKMKIVFSGSSVLDVIKGGYDLSRRVHLLHLPGLSFREYLNRVTGEQFEPLTVEAILQDKTLGKQYQEVPKLLGHFKHYLATGYYPFVEDSTDSFRERLARVVENTIYEDIAKFFQLKTENLHYFKKLLIFLASIPPGEASINAIAKNLGIDHKTVQHYLDILDRSGLARIISRYKGGVVQLRHIGKVFVNNTTLLTTLNYWVGESLSIGALRELFFCQTMLDAGENLFCSDIGDFQTKKVIFEIGGKNKTTRQIQAATLPAYVVKDDILVRTGNQLPLYVFGFLY